TQGASRAPIPSAGHGQIIPHCDNRGRAYEGCRKMIEFKAECGHTVRAKDEDAGGIVKCSYCGRPANVPEGASDDLDFLFGDIEQPDEGKGFKKRRRSRGKGHVKRVRRPGEFNPFAVVLRLCYGALLIIIVIVVGRMFVIPLFKGDGITKRIGAFKTQSEKSEPTTSDDTPKRREPPKPGLIAREKLIGLYVNSTPPGATVFCMASAKAPAAGRINNTRGVAQFRAGQVQTHLPDGDYVVEVVFRWNDPKLTLDAGYMDFRRDLLRASDSERAELLDEYFLPDEGIIFADETPEQIYLVRQYRNVELRNRQSKGVRALFLPRILQANGRLLSIEKLITHYIPEEVTYSFDRKYVRGELLFNGVKEKDVPFVIEALSRIGVIPYITKERRTLLFKIGIHDGSFAARTIGDRGR
ncbi:MAG: hypothetical protein ACE5HE_12310, partial [Phycisphaerae bacterium]